MNKRLNVLSAAFELLCVLLPSAFLCSVWPWQHLLSQTVTAGGDTASHYYPALIMRDVLIPHLQWTGWTMGNYAGFPIFHFYSTLPFLAIGLLGYAIPLPVAFKLITLVGPTTLPLGAAYLFRAHGYRRGGPVLAAASVLPFLFQQGNSMWGGNIPSVLAGEFCHAIGLTLSLVFLGHLHRLSRGIGSWVTSGFLLAAIGLSHAFAFLGAVWIALWYVRPRPDGSRVLPRIAPAFALAGMLLAFWGFPLVPRVKFTTEWTMIWNIQEWTEVIPELLWPAAGLAALNVVAMLLRIKRFVPDRHGMMLFAIFGAFVLFGVSPALGFPDIRFVPIGQIFAGFLAADLLGWIASRMRFPGLNAAAVLVAVLGWTWQHAGYVPSWLDWNYSGYEGKDAWSLFRSINEHVHGDLNSPRMVFEHSQSHNRFGSSRAFENLPLFAGRSTLEGVFHQVSPNSPFVFYLQSLVGEKASGPFHQYSYARLDPAAALPRLKTYNVGTIVATSEKACAAYDADPNYRRTFRKGGYSVYDIPSAVTGYVVPAANQPILYTGPDYHTAFYRWFKHDELLDLPLVPASIAGSDATARFALQASSLQALPREPYAGDCRVTTNLEQERISFDTTCPGRPHIVKVSYFPRWVAVDGSPVDLVSPGFMLVTPRSTHFELEYRETALDWFALATTWTGLLWALVVVVNGRARRGTERLARTTLAPAMRFFEPRSRRLPANALLLLLCVTASVGERYRLRDEDSDYRSGQEAYQQRRFEDAARIYRDYVNNDSDRPKMATALLQLGVSYSEMKQPALAVATLERLRFDFPNIVTSAQALFHLARGYQALGDVDQARKTAAELLARFGDTPWANRLRKEHAALVTGDAGLPNGDAPAGK